MHDHYGEGSESKQLRLSSCQKLQMNCVTPRVTCSVQLPRRKRVPYNSPRYDIGDSIATTLDEPDRGNAHPFPRVLATVVCVCVYRKNGSIAAMLNNIVPLTSPSPCFQGGHGPKRAVSKLIMQKTYFVPLCPQLQLLSSSSIRKMCKHCSRNVRFVSVQR